jgi:hypothetical protein
MPTLFINPVSESIHLIVIEKTEILEELSIQKGDDFSVFPEMVVEVVDRYTVQEIWCICGP